MRGEAGKGVNDDRLRAHTDRLADLLAGATGAELLAQWQRVAYLSATARPANEPDSPTIGIWQVEAGPDGVALRRHPAADTEGWADATYVPPAGTAARLVLVGESAARGWPYDPRFTCAGVLAGRLNDGHGFQCVDLARSGATTAELNRLAERLPLLAPDVVVSFVGNNWTLFDHDEASPELLDLHVELARALREGGLPAMRKALSCTVLARARRYLDRLTEVERRCGARIVIVVPEFNLCGWAPTADIEVPVMPPAALAAWYELYDRVQEALGQQRWSDAIDLTARMRDLDQGSSPVTGSLAGRAALSRGDGPLARHALEESRDAVCELFVRHTPRVTRLVQDLLVNTATQRGWSCVDLRRVLSRQDLPDLPDARYFLDYCHLTDIGIEKAMAAVTDAVLDRENTPVGPGLTGPERALINARVAGHLAYTGQPAEAVREVLHDALAAAPQLRGLLTALRDVLSAPVPRWSHPSMRDLLSLAPVRSFAVALATAKGLPSWLWTLRECLSTVLGTEETRDSTSEADLLLTPGGLGHGLPNWLPPRHHLPATTRSVSLPFALSVAADAALEVTYRMPHPPTGEPSAAQVLFNDDPVGSLPHSRQWADRLLPLAADSARTGVNRIRIRWPVPDIDPTHAWQTDADAMARGEPPYVLPVFGEIFSARVRTAG